MEPQFKTSFIPKKPIEPSLDKKVLQGGNGVNFLMLIAIIVFITSILLAGAVFAYKVTLKNRIKSQIDTLETARDAFEPNFIAEATRLNTRIVSANKLLNGHVAPSEMFELLEKHTLETVSFNSFLFEDGTDGTIKITASGEADSFKSVVLQSDRFGQNGYMRDVLFDGLEPTDTGDVTFKMTASLDPQLLLYRKKQVIIDSAPVVEEKEDVDQDVGVFGDTNQ